VLASNIPTKFPIPWGNSAGGGFIRPIPILSQIGIQAGAASLTDGFPPLSMTAISAGGTPPFGQDANGILQQISAWSRWYSAGGPVQWDSAFSSAIGGYPSGAVVQALAQGQFWLSTADNNVTNPDTGGAGWVNLQASGATFRASRIVTTSTTLTLAITDSVVGLNRTAGPAAMIVNLPTVGAGLLPNQDFEIQDLAGNFNAFPVTVTAPTGHTIVTVQTYVMNQDAQGAIFHYYSGTNWGVSSS
jgi:hypothetical protein